MRNILSPVFQIHVANTVNVGEGHGNPLQYSRLENPMDRGAWVGYSPWGRKESN